MMEKKDFTLTVRRMAEQDTDMFSDFLLSTSEQTRFFMDAHPYDRATAELFTSPRELARNDTIRYVAVIPDEAGEVMAGYLFFWNWFKKVPWLGIAVSDRFQGMGAGMRIMTFATEEAKRHGKGGILLTTKKNNLPAQHLYLKCGYEMLGEYDYGHASAMQFLMINNFDDEAAGSGK